MNPSKSKFDFGTFDSGYHHFFANAGKYTKEQAVALYMQEYANSNHPFIVEEAHVKWRAGINEDCEPCVGWWADYSPAEKRSVECWAFRPDFSNKEREQNG